MDLVKIGQFIAELRKQQGLTQEQFGEKIGVTNKTVSRWETGAYMPPADVLMIMSDLFGVTINEILSGKRLSESEYKEAAEENLRQTISSSNFDYKEKIEFFKRKWRKDHISLFVILAIILALVIVLSLVLKRTWLVGFSPIVPLIEYGFQNNQMMAYVERQLYD